MKIIITLLISTFTFTCNGLFAQNEHFTTSGVIEFEKTINMYALFSKSINKDNEGFAQPAFDQYKKNQPQFKKLKSTLNFSGDKTLFNPAIEDVTPGNFWGNQAMVNQNNTIFTDLDAKNSITQKKIFEETFLIKDSTRKVRWKITDETREIAGFICRRANALVLDSVYVVAFYTDKIPVSGGPESFTGLPGMILGVALPHENVTWFATKVTDITVDPKALTPPKKGKPVNNKELRKTLEGVMKDWGTDAQAYLKGFML